jgi:pantetheine-phosphate adenylyltransferase
MVHPALTLKLRKTKVIRSLRGQAKFRHAAVALGGTFDILHRGHERLFERAFTLGAIVFVGITSDTLVEKLRKDHRVRRFDTRVLRLKNFLRARGWLERARIVKLQDRFGPASRRKRLEALIVSEDTRSSGRKVNAIRRARGLPPLRLYVVKLVRDSAGSPISGTRIRHHEIDTSGRSVYRRYRGKRVD